MRIVVVIIQAPFKRVHQSRHRRDPVGQLRPQTQDQRGVLFIGTADRLALVDDGVREVVGTGADGEEDDPDANQRRDVQAQPATKSGRGQGGECLVKCAVADRSQRLVREDVARNHKEYGYHDVAGDQHVDDGQLQGTVVRLIEPPADSYHPRIGEEKVEVEHQETCPSSQPVQRGDRV